MGLNIRLLVLLSLFVPIVGYAAGPIGPQTISQTPLASGTKFASPTGTGTACSLAAPCSIFTVVGLVVPGDVVFLRGGIYNAPTVSTSLDFTVHGTPGAPITFESYPGETAITDGSAVTEGTQRYIRVLSNYNILRRIETRNNPMQGIYIKGNNNILDGCYVHDNKISGIHIADGGYILPYGNQASYNEIKNCTVKNNSDVNTSGGGNADGISISAGTGNMIHHNWAEHNSDDGIDTWRSQNSHVWNNVSTNNGIGTGNGMGFKCGGAASSGSNNALPGDVPNGPTMCDHNISYSNKTAGFDDNSGANSTFDFNTAWNNPNVGFSGCTGAGQCVGNTIVKNNISLANVGGNTSGTATFTNNSWQRSGTPAFISTDPLNANFLRPTVGGGFEDIGAYAVVGPDTTPPTAPVISASANGAGQITVTITTLSSDNVGVAGYNLKRCTPSPCTPTVIKATLAANATSYPDTGVASGTGYSYTMNAFDAAGNQSVYSNVASATTSATFPRILGYDWFDTCADNVTPPTGWTGGYQNDFVCISGQLRAGGVALNTFSSYNAVTNSGNGWCQGEIELISGSGTRAPGCSLNFSATPTVTGWSFRPQLTAGSTIRKDVAGVGTVLATETTVCPSWQQGDKYYFEKQGDTMKGFQKRGSSSTLCLQVDAIDAAITGNRYGMALFIAAGSPSDVQIDKMVFGDFVGSDPVHPTISSVDALTTSATVVSANSPVTIRVETATLSKVEPISAFPGNVYTYPSDVLAAIPSTTFIKFCPRDAADVENVAGCLTDSSITPPPTPDTTPAVLTNTTTTTPLPATTTSWTLSISSNEPVSATYGLTDLAWNAAGSVPMSCFSLTCSAIVTGINTTPKHFYVRSSDTAGNVNLTSLDVTIVAAASSSDTTKPSTVANVVAVPLSNSQATVNWGAITDNVAVDHYQVFISIGSTCASLAPAGAPVPVGTTTQTIVTLATSTLYSVSVTGYDTSQNTSLASNCYPFTTLAMVDNTPPNDMTALTVKPYSASILLDWAPGQDNVGVTVSTIEVCKGALCATVPFEVTATTKLINQFQGAPLLPNTVYCVRGKHADAVGLSSTNYSATVCSTTTPSGYSYLTQPRQPALGRLPLTQARSPRVP